MNIHKIEFTKDGVDEPFCICNSCECLYPSDCNPKDCLCCSYDDDTPYLKMEIYYDDKPLKVN